MYGGYQYAAGGGPPHVQRSDAMLDGDILIYIAYAFDSETILSVTVRLYRYRLSVRAEWNMKHVFFPKRSNALPHSNVKTPYCSSSTAVARR